MKKTLIAIILVLLDITAASADEPSMVRIMSPDGKLFGTLRSSHKNKNLIFVQPGGNELEIGSCSDTKKYENFSPDKKYKVILVERNCGVTVDLSSLIFIEKKNVRKGIAIFEGSPKITFIWHGEKKLEVHHSRIKTDRIFLQLEKIYDISVGFVADLEPVEPNKYMDFSNFNYGATGRSAGLPQELLLRVAGWAQEFSGLHRKEWGHWESQSPYGDDPRGSANILNGIKYYEENYNVNK